MQVGLWKGNANFFHTWWVFCAKIVFGLHCKFAKTHTRGGVLCCSGNSLFVGVQKQAPLLGKSRGAVFYIISCKICVVVLLDGV